MSKKRFLVLLLIFCLLIPSFPAGASPYPTFTDSYEREGFNTYDSFDQYSYDQGYRFSNGVAWITGSNMLFGCIDKAGNVIVPFIWEDCWDLGEGYTFVTRTEGGETVTAVLDKKGNPLFGEGVPAIESVGAPFNNGYSWAKLEEGFAVFSKDGNLIPLSSGLTPDGAFSDGRLLVQNRHDMYGYVNTAGEEVIPCAWSHAYPFSEGFAAVRSDRIEITPEPNEDAWKYDDLLPLDWLILDRDGDPLGGMYFSAVRPFSDGLAAVRNEDYEWGFINREGELVLGYRWNYAGDFHNNRAPVSNPELDPDMAGFINSDGELETGWEFELFGRYVNGIVPIYCTYKGGFVFVNKYGSPIGLPGQEWEKISNFVNGYAVVHDGYGYGYVDSSGMLAISCEWDAAMPFSEDLAWVENDEWRGFINEKGRKIIDCTGMGVE